jgi:hypothetical protein
MQRGFDSCRDRRSQVKWVAMCWGGCADEVSVPYLSASCVDQAAHRQRGIYATLGPRMQGAEVLPPEFLSESKQEHSGRVTIQRAALSMSGYRSTRVSYSRFLVLMGLRLRDSNVRFLWLHSGW